MAALSLRMVLLGAVVLLACTLAAHGRYLPTRADDSRHEQIKELLRTLLEMSDDDNTYGRPIYPYDYREDGFRAKRSPGNTAPRQTEEA